MPDRYPTKPAINGPRRSSTLQPRAAKAPAPVITTRHLWFGDKAALLAHFLGLSQEDRILRFCSPVGDRFIEKYVDDIDWNKSVVIGVFADGRLIGCSEMIPTDPRWKREAEIAVSIDAGWQGQGHGETALRLAMLAARNRYITTVKLMMLSENRAMAHLAQAAGLKLSPQYGILTGTGQTMPPTYLSLAEEFSLDARARRAAALAGLRAMWAPPSQV